MEPLKTIIPRVLGARAPFRDIQVIEDEARLRNIIHESGIPPMWSGVTFDSSNPNINKRGFSLAREYAQKFSYESPSLVIFSRQYGSGKTHLAACIANYVLREKMLSVKYIKARDIILEIQRTYRPDATRSEAEVLNKLFVVQLLVLDDVGVDRPGEWLRSIYWHLMDRRMELRKPVVLTTNYPIKGDGMGETLEDRIGGGAVSRMVAMCQGNIIQLGNKDLRLENV